MDNRKLEKKVKEIILKNKGERIREIDIARKLRISRTPVREILNRLEDAGIIERKKKGGTYVKKINIREINEMYEIREYLEGLAARKTAEKVTEEIINKLKEIEKKYREALKNKDLSSMIEKDAEFHLTIAEESGNKMLYKLMDNLHLLTKIFRISFKFPHYFERYIENPFSHKKIIEAIKSRNPDKAEKTIRKHIKFGRETLIKIYIEGR
jgi:DNA-binding GntR family transcriptional regulator